MAMAAPKPRRRRGGGAVAPTRQSAARPAAGRWEGGGAAFNPAPPGAFRRAERRGLVEDGSQSQERSGLGGSALLWSRVVRRVSRLAPGPVVARCLLL